MSGSRLRLLAAVAAALAPLVACRDRDPAPPPVARDAGPARRVIVPAVVDVRPLPPHAIRADGVGPYKLGAALDGILAMLPGGPRLVLLDLQGVVDVSVIRAEDDGVLVGGESVGAAAYIAVVRPDLARTESGVGVGSTRAQLEGALGAPLVDPHVARDPRLAAYSALPGARFVLADDRVLAVLLRRREPDGNRAAHEAVGDAACPEPPHREPAIAASGLRAQAPQTIPACLGSGGELAVIAGDAIVLVGGEGDRVRKIATVDVHGLRFAAAVRAEGARDELVTVAERGDESGRAVVVASYRLDGGKLVKSTEQEVYRIAAISAGWIGARLADLDLLLEIDARPDVLVVGGALVHSQEGSVRDLAPLEPVRIPRRRRTAPVEAGAPTPPHDAGATAPGAPGTIDAADAPDSGS